MMLSAYFTQRQLKRFSRFFVVLFVMSWMNIAFQLPVHAAMMQEKAQMSQMNMQGMNCHCPPAICDVILASDNQSFDGVSFINLAALEFNSLYIDTIVSDDLSVLTGHELHESDLVFRQHNPPPLFLNTILLI